MTEQREQIAATTEAASGEDEQRLGPFGIEGGGLADRHAVRDDISQTQTHRRGTPTVTARHVRSFLYDHPFHTDAPKYHETPLQPRNAPIRPEER